MSRIKFILFWLGAFCITNISFGQQATMPTQCTNPGNGFTVGGAFSLNIEYGCLDFTNNSAVARVLNPQAPSGATVSGGNYIFNLRDGRNIAGNYSTRLDTTVTTPGIYWIMQAVNEAGQVYVSCKSFEIIKTEQPDVSVSSCGTNSMTVNFLNTDKNKTHGGYRIVWGDGGQDFIPSITAASFPFSKSHPYATPPTSKPQIVAIYTRGTGNVEQCRSTPYPFEFETNNKPRINELEGLTGGTSNKITMVEGTDGKEYTLEQKPKTGNWADTGKKITRNTGEAFKTETITGLNAANEYCFRLKTIDGCGNAIYSSVEGVCTIIPKATVISSKEVKLDWTSPDPAVIRYSIGYNESPTGANPNNAAPVTPTATTYTFNSLDCRKLYDFQVTAFIGTTPADRIVIKSPTILVNPTTTPRLAPMTVGTVSVENNNLIRFNILPLDITPANYIFYRSEGGVNNFTQIKTTTDNFYQDRNVEPTKQQYCYKVEYQDACGNTSEQSAAFCSVFLTSKQSNTLNWTPYVIQSTNPYPIEYYIQSIDNNNYYQTVNLTTNTSQNVKQQIEDLLDLTNSNGEAKFVIRAIQKIAVTLNGTPSVISLDVSSNEYIFITPAQLYIPTAFSPNGDDKNDTFTAKGRYIVEFNLEIYDRWGNVIFESKDLDTGWNGTANDGVTPAPAGNYGFKVYGLDPAGQKFEKVGSVTLIR